MRNDAEQKYVEGLKQYHKKLEVILAQNYGIKTQYLETLSWGYHTTAFYIKSAEDREYLLKMADWSTEKEAAIRKDLELSNLLRNVIPTPTYIETLEGKLLCRFEDKILRVSHYISGLSPLDMSYSILGQMIDVLKQMHSFSASPSQNEVHLPILTKESHLKGFKLLHGDLTPHNILVSFGKIVAVMDFETSFVGPVEYDLARTSVFSWNYMGKESFEQTAKFVLERYNHSEIDTQKFLKYVVEDAQKHLAAIYENRQKYDRDEKWKKDRDFALAQLERLILLKL